MRRALSIVLFVTCLAPAVASAQQGPTRDQIRQLLSGIEDVPSDDDWRRLGDGVLPLLMELYNDPREAPFVRLRAVGATAAFPRPAVRTFLLAVAHAEGQTDLYVAEALNALARAFGPRATDELRRSLAHDEPLVRETAARQLGRIGTARAETALRARLRVERTPHVRATIQRALD